MITQKDPKVLYKIRKILGFGVVKRGKDGKYRYIVTKRVNYEKFKGLLDDRIHLRTSQDK